MLIGAGLFLRTLRNLQTVDLGYPRDHLLLMRVDTLTAGYKGPQRAALYRTLIDRFQAIPGVRAVTLSDNGLFSGRESGDQITVEGYKPSKSGEEHAAFDEVGPNYFATVGIPMLLGRDIGPQDTAASTPVCVINETLARFFFGKQNPIGKHITDEFPDTRVTFQIVGVAKDDRDHNLRGEIQRRFFVALFQPLGEMPADASFEIRTRVDPNSIQSALRRVVEQTDSSIPMLDIFTLDDLVDRNLTQDRAIAQLTTFFGALALLLASVGMYGVLSYSIERRTNEIGIRMALGAKQSTVLGMVFAETLAVVLIGLAIGLPLALAATRLIATDLYGLSATDPLTIAGATGVLLAVAMLACYLPARRASKVDPLIALRYE